MKDVEKTPARGVFVYLKRHIWVVLAICLIAAGAVGATLKYMEESARSLNDANNRLAKRDTNILDAVNPFIAAPSPTATPQLSKEYIYAGSRLLAVEDAGANAAPPADLAVWRPSSGDWWVMGGQGSAQTTFNWGTTGDVPVPGDYDGDGKTDFAVRRSSNGTWYIVYSGGSGAEVGYGLTTDVAVPADYDGDGKTDIAVWRPSTGVWYVIRSSDQVSVSQQIGLSTDIPAPADYDGDGKADFGVWRNSDTTFYNIDSSTNTVAQMTFGTSGDSPVPADYDGDGKADHALRGGNTWKIKRSSDSQLTTQNWELASDTAVQNDYDGDGKVDIAVWRPSNGWWYIKKSSDGQTRSEQWGTTGDIPVPAFFRR